MGKRYCLLLMLLASSCAFTQRSPSSFKADAPELLAENRNPSFMSYHSNIRDGFRLSSCKLIKEDQELSVVFEFKNDRGELWTPQSYVLGSVDDQGNLHVRDERGLDVTQDNLKVSKNQFKNNLHKIDNTLGLYEFDFHNAKDPSSIRRFSAIKNAGWKEVNLQRSLETKKTVQAQCLFF